MHSEWKVSAQGGVAIQAKLIFGDTEGKFTAGIESGGSTDITKTNSFGVRVVSNSDTNPHGGDMFFLWMNPVPNRHLTNCSVTGMSWTGTELTTPPGSSPIIVPVYVEELTGAAPMPADKKQFLEGLNTNDIQQLLSLDPFLNGAGLDPNRFTKVKTNVEILVDVRRTSRRGDSQIKLPLPAATAR